MTDWQIISGDVREVLAGMKDLTAATQEALLMIGFGVSAHEDGFYSLDDPDERLDFRSVAALARRGLVWYYTTGGSPMRGCWGLTPDGEALFEEIRELRSKERW